jgi:hypothetical protein
MKYFLFLLLFTYTSISFSQTEPNNEKYIEKVIKSKDSTLNPNSELALHFKKFISEEELNKNVFRSIRISFRFDKKEKMIDVKANSGKPVFSGKLVEVFKKFPFEKLNIKSTNVLEEYNFSIITKEYNKIIIQSPDNPNVFIPACFDKNCGKHQTPAELRDCLYQNVNSLIDRDFDVKMFSKTKVIGKVKIYCNFQIDVDAKIINVKVEAPNSIIASEIEQIIKNISKVYKPAYSNGVAIKTSYLFALRYNVGENKFEDTFNEINKRFN